MASTTDYPEHPDNESLAPADISDLSVPNWLVEVNSYQLVRDTFSQLPLMVAIYSLEGVLISVNEEFTQILGWTTADLVTQDVLAACYPDPSTCQQVRAWMLGGQYGWQSIPTHTRSAQVIETLWSYIRLPDGSGIACGQNINILHQAQMALLETTERYALLIMGINDGVWDWDLRTNEVYYSPRWKVLLGYQEDELGQTLEEWVNRIHPQDVERVKLNLTLHVQGQTPHFQQEYRIRHKNGQYRWALSRGQVLRDQYGQAYRMAGSLTDQTEHRMAETQLLHDALHDLLTGLPNRALLLDRLGQALRHARRRDTYHFALLFIDIDRFKVINDSLGHSSGDQLLIEFTHRLQQYLRPDDTIARVGGDEFVILLDDLGELDDALIVAQRLVSAFQAPFIVRGQSFFATASVGVHLKSDLNQPADEYIRNADIAMYRAKVAGGNRYVIFQPEMHATLRERMQLENSLYQALEKQELCVYYQPIYSLNNNQLKGFEALIRWQHPVEGLIRPDKFIPIAEETGLIIPIGAYVLWHACQQMQQWYEQFPDLNLVLSVNVSARQLSQPHLVDTVFETLTRTGLAPEKLQLEITETTVVENPDAAMQTLLKLKQQQIRLAMDDFGTGYSSLGYLSRLPIDVLKIDRCFVKDIEHNENSLEIIRAILGIAQGLKLTVVAEGIETEFQAQQLRELGCPVGQGYYFSVPLDVAATTQLIRGYSGVETVAGN
ncbi:bifunctional diguanylate cyclase/phosphodiesterase [Synechococcus sp. PCC 6312]|uniref:putative bifunctional diguanylate cyclase/phosphodiesterase n=1 Tax=Synechococcus sp. (strain ATCC 27167 / PCC 6312) TaxID=195253 RepID=UPI00029F1BED|nr:GGDEF domain-containing phosphodiesterase [Synechococcus sp. PCC 6312]AFY60954.1 PAS domain S-box/diguanylate cyclase (GGDEF) domain-containing protein [Synechococcus sp. PCC 6312]